MLTRALIVLLLVLNLGVALWWTLRSPQPAAASVPNPLGVARLQMPGEPDARPVTAPVVAAPVAAAPVAAETTPAAAPAEPPATPEPPPAAPQCFSFGPFADAAALTHAQTRLQPLAQRVVARPQRVVASEGWRVFVPPYKSREDVMAAAQRVADAGFDDYQVISEGAEANALALGRYSTEDAARKRANALQAAGFAAQVETLGGADQTAGGWVDVRAAADFNAAKAQAQAGAAQHRTLDCAKLK